MCALRKNQLAEPKSIFFNIRLTPTMHAELVRRAQANERTVAGEIRAALKLHLEQVAA